MATATATDPCTSGSVEIAVTAVLLLTDCDCVNTACNGFWRISVGAATPVLGAGTGNQEHLITAPCTSGGTITVLIEWTGEQGAVDGIGCSAILFVTV